MILALLALGCGLGPIAIGPAEPAPKTEIEPGAEPPAPTAPSEETVATPLPAETPVPTLTPTPTITPFPSPTKYSFQFFSRCAPATPDPQNPKQPAPCCPYDYIISDTSGYCVPRVDSQPPSTPRHGLWIAFILPAVILGTIFVVQEFATVRYVQPKGLDLSTVRIKARDGLFLEATISLTARRQLTIASTRMTWGRVQEFVEKTLEQELIHEAIQYNTLEDLEGNIKSIADSFYKLPIVNELAHDFGLEVMRFNIEIGYPEETMDALNRKAEASADGTAYLAYAAAAHMNPESRESRELYRVYQETKGQVDAARNLGGGLTRIAEMFTKPNGGSRDDDSSK